MKMQELREPKSISKVLSGNDTGETGGHQAGMLIPKDQNILSFFPKLDSNEKNPRALLRIFDDAGHPWKWNFIYYNNKLFGGTRNEYRLTGMTAYFRTNALKPGDTITLSREEKGYVSIEYLRSQNFKNHEASPSNSREVNGVKRTRIELGSTWKVIKY